ncbi:unnamed protein product [Closterium sp. Naga37s-1]|nr:unnamed protein product [Closterium sp. Naga37s-1]
MNSSAVAPPFNSAGYSGGVSPAPSGGGSPPAGGDLSPAPASAGRHSTWNGMSFPPTTSECGAQRTPTPVGSPVPPFVPTVAPAAAPCAAAPFTPTVASAAVSFVAASGSPAPLPPPPPPPAAAPVFGGGGGAGGGVSGGAAALPAWSFPAPASSPAATAEAAPAAAAEEGTTTPEAPTAPEAAAAAAAAAAKDPPCAACKSLRRKCTRECLLLPYFPRNQPEKFHVVHKVFGASNVSKMLQDIPVAQREDAVASLEYEAQARLRDPVYGCVGVICLLQKEMVALQEQLRDIEASSLSSSPNATHGSAISGDGAMYGVESSAAAVPSSGAGREEGDEC